MNGYAANDRRDNQVVPKLEADMERWQQAVEKAMADNQVKNSHLLVLAILELLKNHHTNSIMTGQGSFQLLASIEGEPATTLAEGLRNYARMWAKMIADQANSGRVVAEKDEVRREQHTHKANQLEASSRHFKAVADLLDHFLPVWNAEGYHQRQNVTTHSIQHREPGEGPPDDDQTGGGIPTGPVRT